jgi:hypothetical protein
VRVLKAKVLSGFTSLIFCSLSVVSEVDLVQLRSHRFALVNLLRKIRCVLVANAAPSHIIVSIFCFLRVVWTVAFPC